MKQAEIYKKLSWAQLKNKLPDNTQLNYSLKGKTYQVFFKENNTTFFCNLYPPDHREVVGISNTNDVDYTDFINNYKPTIDNVTPLVENKVAATDNLIVSWSILKSFYENTKVSSFMNYVEFSDYYYIWLCFRSQKLYIPRLIKGTSECTDFEDNYKSICNVNEALRTRITTNKLGRKMHSRFITFTTARQDRFDNTDWEDKDYGDFTCIMKDINGNVTTVGSEAKETWFDWEPPYDYELSGGYFYVPAELGSRSFGITSIEQSNNIATGYASGHMLRKNSMITITGADQSDYNGQQVITGVSGDAFMFEIENNPASPATGTLSAEEGDDAWEIHAVGVPDIPVSMGGTVHFIANPRIKWIKDNFIQIDAHLNPAELIYNPIYHTNKMRCVVKHPVGAQTEFQLMLKVFR